MPNLLDFFLHVDKHLADFSKTHPGQIYGLLFGIIFSETGLIVLPFLPGDSLLFAAGALAANPANGLNPWLLAPLLFAAALIGDNVNYLVGKHFGRALFKPGSKLFKQAHLEQTEAFLEKYGGQAIIRARFVPIVRTFAPFTAGVGTMHWRQFVGYSVLATLLWVGLCFGGGALLGGIPFFKAHFDLVALAIVVVSVVPAVVEIVKRRRQGH